jgi:hypothetical protein
MAIGKQIEFRFQKSKEDLDRHENEHIAGCAHLCFTNSALLIAGRRK